MTEVEAVTNKVHVRKGDSVMVISGKEKGRRGKVLEVSPKEGKVIVERINVMTKHAKARKQGDPSGLIKAEGAIYACKVMLYCSKCAKPTRVGHSLTGDEKQRICRRCGEAL